MITATEAKEKRLFEYTPNNELTKHQAIARLELFFNKMVEACLDKGETGFTVTESEIKLGISGNNSHYTGLMDLALMLLLDYGYHVRVISNGGEMMLKVFWDDYVEVTYSIS